VLTFSPALGEGGLCSGLAPVTVALKGPNQDRKGRATLSARASAAPPPPSSQSVRDGDKLKLTCLPGG
jgi:hypothetical protein